MKLYKLHSVVSPKFVPQYKVISWKLPRKLLGNSIFLIPREKYRVHDFSVLSKSYGPVSTLCRTYEVVPLVGIPPVFTEHTDSSFTQALQFLTALTGGRIWDWEMRL